MYFIITGAIYLGGSDRAQAGASRISAERADPGPCGDACRHWRLCGGILGHLPSSPRYGQTTASGPIRVGGGWDSFAGSCQAAPDVAEPHWGDHHHMVWVGGLRDLGRLFSRLGNKRGDSDDDGEMVKNDPNP